MLFCKTLDELEKSAEIIIMADKDNLDNDDNAEGSELNRILNRRQNMNDAIAKGEQVEHEFKNQASKNVYVEFQEFSRKEIKALEKKHQE